MAERSEAELLADVVRRVEPADVLAQWRRGSRRTLARSLGRLGLR